MDNNELVHHGVRGMKWGIRRYQRKDGSLTIAGKRRVAKLDDEYRTLTGHRHSSENSSHSSSTSKKRISEMSDDELKKRIDRIDLERQYKKLVTPAESASKGKTFIKKIGNDVLVPVALDLSKQALKSYGVKQINKKIKDPNLKLYTNNKKK